MFTDILRWEPIVVHQIVKIITVKGNVRRMVNHESETCWNLLNEWRYIVAY